MPSPTWTLSQPGGAGAGVANDELLACREGVAVQLTSEAAASYAWAIVDAPAGEAAIVAATSQVASWTPAALGYTRRVRLRLTTPGGSRILIAEVSEDDAGATIGYGLPIPAFGERKRESANGKGAQNVFARFRLSLVLLLDVLIAGLSDHEGRIDTLELGGGGGGGGWAPGDAWNSTGQTINDAGDFAVLADSSFSVMTPEIVLEADSTDIHASGFVNATLQGGTNAYLHNGDTAFGVKVTAGVVWLASDGDAVNVNSSGFNWAAASGDVSLYVAPQSADVDGTKIRIEAQSVSYAGAGTPSGGSIELVPGDGGGSGFGSNVPGRVAVWCGPPGSGVDSSTGGPGFQLCSDASLLVPGLRLAVTGASGSEAAFIVATKSLAISNAGALSMGNTAHPTTISGSVTAIGSSGATSTTVDGGASLALKGTAIQIGDAGDDVTVGGSTGGGTDVVVQGATMKIKSGADIEMWPTGHGSVAGFWHIASGFIRCAAAPSGVTGLAFAGPNGNQYILIDNSQVSIQAAAGAIGLVAQGAVNIASTASSVTLGCFGGGALDHSTGFVVRRWGVGIERIGIRTPTAVGTASTARVVLATIPVATGPKRRIRATVKGWPAAAAGQATKVDVFVQNLAGVLTEFEDTITNVTGTTVLGTVDTTINGTNLEIGVTPLAATSYTWHANDIGDV